MTGKTGESDGSARLTGRSRTRELPPELARLPRGRHGLPREFVARNHRERLIAGLAQAVAKKGYRRTTISDITREAAVSRRTFYEHFDSIEECFVAAYDAVAERLTTRTKEAFSSEDDWPQAMRAALEALLEFLEREPAFARLVIVEAIHAGPRVVDRYREAVDAFIGMFRRGRQLGSDRAEGLSARTEEALVGGITSLLARRILANGAHGLTDLLPDVVEFALAPYLGVAEARRVALGVRRADRARSAG